MSNKLNDRLQARKLYKIVFRHLRQPTFVHNVHDFIRLVFKNQNTPPGDGSFSETQWNTAYEFAKKLDTFITTFVKQDNQAKENNNDKS